MISYKDARQRVLKHLDRAEAETRRIAELRKDPKPRERKILGIGPSERDILELVLLDDQTIEDDFGWVFFFESKAFLDTGNTSHALAGNAPLLVSRMDGSVHVTGTARPIEFYIENFKRSGAPHGGRDSQ